MLERAKEPGFLDHWLDIVNKQVILFKKSLQIV
jgi:hypothetical protein